MKIHKFSKNEEIVNAITHGIGALSSIVGLILLIVYTIPTGNPWQITSGIIFGSTMLIMYLCSTIVHSLPEGKWKDIFQVFDHSAIYLFIAGSYTPFLLIHLRSDIGWILFGIIWGIAILGIAFKIFFVKRFVVLSTLFYILMGWLIVLVWEPLTAVLHETAIMLLMTGGLFYTVGTIFYVWRSFKYHHAVWHLFVLAGSAFHYVTIFYYVL
ncbi:PAQR family membrane homeostasis protein TrhA [Oceanobacillus polygoni]|uniref:Hemolysin III n=1 Tax=Oceanobacillus polygoni TaxID=1235259 RepID=A0A9X0YS79_9BACI|nr:hemolysin III family protein [Oceanobacillus polygoni]MBP2077925.1 hemolysin III [Oceanobacillus polygoni]